MPIPSAAPAWNAESVDRLAREVGGSVVTDAWGPAIAVGTDALPEGPFVAPLSDLGLITVAGDEAAKFLHGQLTNDVERLTAGEARWAGYCSAKGRLLSTFRYWRDADSVLLTVSRPLAAPVARRLSMFVLRAKARVADASDAHSVFGLAGLSAARAAAEAFGLSVPGADAVASAGGAHLVGLPDLPERTTAAPLGRWLLVVPSEAAPRAWSALRGGAAAVCGAAWRRTEVLAGIPRIVAGTSELFVPQMINFESVDGVNFRKGCYPGQEVVARSQYLGKLKRRMFLGYGAGVVPEPGSDVFPGVGGEPCGQVVLAAPDGDGGFDVLFESQTAAVEAGPVRCGDVVLSLRTLPYTLKAID